MVLLFLPGAAWLTVRMTSKKSETIEVRLPFATKQAFADRCRAEGVTMSAAVREYVDARLARRPSPLVPLAVLAAIAALALVTPVASAPDFSAGFETLDRNGDGVVVSAEIAREPSSCTMVLPLRRKRWTGGARQFVVCQDRPDFAALDRNGDGLASREEYRAHREAFFRRGYAALDRNGDASLDAAEYAAASKISFLAPAPKLASFLELDRNRDGRVVWDEYLR